jgi:inosine-uridine nucleoside N-ribohydrolase
LTTVPARVDVENVGRLTAGMTVVDASGRNGEPNCAVAMSVDVARFRDLLDTRLSRLDASLQMEVALLT